MLHFKFILSAVFLLTIAQFGCFNFPEQEQSSLTEGALRYTNRIMDENPGASYDINVIDSSVGHDFLEPVGYLLGLNVDDKVVLTNYIDSLRNNGVYRFWKSGYGTGSSVVDLEFRGIKIKCDTLDSIKIMTDAVIALETLDMSWCNLTRLPPEIGKIRTQSLDISENRMSQLPMEIMQLLAPPQYYPYTRINLNGLPNLKFDSLPDTLQDWFNNIYSKQDFQ